MGFRTPQGLQVYQLPSKARFVHHKPLWCTDDALSIVPGGGGDPSLTLKVTEGGAPPPLNNQERRLQRGRLRGAARRALLPGRLLPRDCALHRPQSGSSCLQSAPDVPKSGRQARFTPFFAPVVPLFGTPGALRGRRLKKDFSDFF